MADSLAEARVAYPSRILACGGRGYTDRDHVRAVLSEFVPDDPAFDGPEVICGAKRVPDLAETGLKGADLLIAQQALDLGLWIGNYPADWDSYGPAAGPIRNRQMLDLHPDLVIAFPGGKGTEDTVAEARRRGIAVRRVNPRPHGSACVARRALGE